MPPGPQQTDSRRVTIYLVLVACFFVQTGFVYLDIPDKNHAHEFSPQAQEGLALWRANNCQACHQIYGFGGFLGPDLTNIASRRDAADWSRVLVDGRKQMPAFEFDDRQRDAIVAFLQEVDGTGVGVPVFTALAEGTDADTLVRTFAEQTSTEVEAAVLAGEEICAAMRCNTCHRPFDVGVQGAPDLTLALSCRTEQTCVDILRAGKGSMPAYELLTEAQLDELVAYMRWLNDNRRELGLHYSRKDNGSSFHWAAVPWFEY